MAAILFVVAVGLGSPTQSLSVEGSTLAPPPAESMRLNVDLQIIVTGLVIAANHLARDGWGESPGFGVLEPGSLNFLDRSVIGNRSGSAANVSDVLLQASIVLPSLLVLMSALASDDDTRMAHLGEDTLVLLEAIAVNFVACTFAKYSARRPRPYVYDHSTPADERNADEASLSFFSGHTSMAFVMASAYSTIFAHRNPGSPAVLPVTIGAHALAAATAALRVGAGKHFWTDVIVGAAVGSAIGFLVPQLHYSDGDSLIDQLGPTAEIRVAPVFYEQGFGASAMLVW
ncbi:phosphatase PAP2 family protein [Myxococcota bacterium]